jgi:tetratricopeptide (TPR) repeat protein
MNKTWIVVIGGVLVLLATGIAQFIFPRTAASPSPAVFVESSPAESTTTPSLNIKEVTVSPPTRATPSLPSVAKGDVIAEWTFKGAYADNPELIKKAEAEIARLTGLLGKGTYSDASIYVGIANQYELIGNGGLEYDYLSRAIGADVDMTSGLPWHNLGVLMERLGALQTARVAYEKATMIQPEMKFYHYAYFEFLTTRMKNDMAHIEKEYTAALKNLGQDSDILSLYSAWKQS